MHRVRYILNESFADDVMKQAKKHEDDYKKQHSDSLKPVDDMVSNNEKLLQKMNDFKAGKITYDELKPYLTLKESDALCESNAFSDAYKSVKNFVYAKKETARLQKELDEKKKKYDELKLKSNQAKSQKSTNSKSSGKYDTLDDLKREMEKRKAEAKPYDDQYRKLINRANKTVDELKKESVTLYEAMCIIDNYLTENISVYTGYKCSNKSIEGVCVGFYNNNDSKEVVDSLNTNFPAVKREYKKYLNNNFINWLKPENYNADKNTVLKGLKIVEITYSYSHIVQKYSPNGKDGYFGEFDIMIEPSNAEAKKVFDVSAMMLYVDNGKILKCSCYDV